MTPTDTIIALEKALEAATPGAWLYRAKSNSFHKPPPEGTQYTYGETILSLSSDEDETPQQAADMEFLLAVVNPLAIRTLLDAHASALRDAARLNWLRDEAWSGEHSGKRLPHVVVFRPGLMPSAVLELAEDALDDAIDDAMAALDDNTKGAAE